jgi:hypothetical protein
VTHSGTTYSASLTVSNLSVATHSIVATYGGAPDYQGSASSALSQSVTAATTSIAAQAATSGGSMTAVLTTAYGHVAGATLTFTTGTTALCTGVTNASGSATCSAGSLANITLHVHGSYTVSYAGSTDYTASSATGKA